MFTAKQLIEHLQKGLQHLGVEDCSLIVWTGGEDSEARNLTVEGMTPDPAWTAEGFHKCAEDCNSIHLRIA